MGFRFRKSINLGGARINISKSGIGYSVGGKGYRYTKKANGGTRTTASIPGTGISYVKDSGKGKSGKTRVKAETIPQAATPNYKAISILFRVLSVPMILLGLLLLLVEPVIGICSIAIGIGEIIVARIFKRKGKEI